VCRESATPGDVFVMSRLRLHNKPHDKSGARAGEPATPLEGEDRCRYASQVGMVGVYFVEMV
jgi:hypothetical protein